MVRTREDVVLPLSEPVRGKDGTLMTEIPIPKDTTVFVGVISSNTRKALWGEDAYEWKPERWLSKLPEAVLDAKIPGVYSNLCGTLLRISESNHLTHYVPQDDILGRRTSLHVRKYSGGGIHLSADWCLDHSGFKFSQLEMSACTRTFMSVTAD